MKPILEYIISKSSKRYVIKATNKTIHQIVREEFDRLGPESYLNHIDVSEVEYMGGLFNAKTMNHMISSAYNYVSISKDNNGIYGYKEFEDFNCDISKWNVSKVKDMCCMFYKCHRFNCDISNWDISKVMNFNHMFDECKNFDKDLSSWKINHKAQKNDMFLGCPLPFDKQPNLDL